MSKEIVEKIVMKAQKEPNFMKAILTDAEKALKEYSLTKEELQFFKGTDEKTLKGLSSSCFQLSKPKPKPQAKK